MAAATVWASIDPEPTPEAAKQIDRDRQELADRRERYRRYDLAADLGKLDSDIEAAREALSVARFAERSPDLFQGDTPVLDPRLKPASSAAQAEARLNALIERRKQVAALDPQSEPADIQALASALDDRKRVLDEHLASHPVSAPIPGTLRLAVSPDADGTRVEAGEVLATVEDDSALEVVVRATLPLLHEAPAGDLYCTVATSGGEEATAAFNSWGVAPSGSGVAPVIRFRLPPGAFEAEHSNLSDAEKPALVFVRLPEAGRSAPKVGSERASLSGVELPALVFVRLPEPARIVPKLALAEWDEDGILAAGWQQGLQRLFPGSRLLAEGRAAVAIVPK